MPDTSVVRERETQGPASGHRGRWGGVFAMSFGAFALVASEFACSRPWPSICRSPKG